MAFHPWITLESYCDLLDTIQQLELIDHVAPIQLTIRLLIPQGSRLLELDEVRRLQDDSIRWDAVADEARAFLKGIEGSNLIRRQRLSLIAMQAYTIGSQLAKDPAKAVLVPHVEEVRRLKGVSRRKKTAPQTPPAPAPVPIPSTEPKP